MGFFTQITISVGIVGLRGDARFPKVVTFDLGSSTWESLSPVALDSAGGWLRSPEFCWHALQWRLSSPRNKKQIADGTVLEGRRRWCGCRKKPQQIG